MTMTREQKEAVVIGVYLDGKKAQYRHPGDRWIDINRPQFDSDVLEYRLKPEPVAGWFVVDKHGQLVQCDSSEQALERVETYDITSSQDKSHRPIYMRECDPPEDGR